VKQMRDEFKLKTQKYCSTLEELGGALSLKVRIRYFLNKTRGWGDIKSVIVHKYCHNKICNGTQVLSS